MTTPRTMQTRPDRPTPFPPLDYTNAETLAATRALRHPVAPVPILDASQYEADAKAIAKRQGGKVGKKPAGRSKQKQQGSYDRGEMTPQAHRLLALLIAEPGNTAKFYGQALGTETKPVSTRVVSSNMSRLRKCGHKINRTGGNPPIYTLEAKT